MKIILTILHVIALAALARAEFPSALKPLAEKFEADRAALSTSAEAQIKPARARYLAALDTAQKAATAAAKTADIAAINAEMETVKSGAVVKSYPPDLPRSFVQDRSAYMNAAETVAKTIPLRLRELGSKYLQTLAALEATATKTNDAGLMKSIAEEKTRVIALMEAAGGGQKNRNVVANADFSQGEPGQFPPAWKAEAEIPVTDATLIAEGAQKFLRFRRLQAQRRTNLLPEKEIVIPAKVRSVEFSVKMRLKGLVPGKDYNTHPGAHVTARDARGEEVAGAWAEVKQNTPWKRITAHFALKPEAKTLRIAIGPFGAAGLLDVDDIEVEFK